MYENLEITKKKYEWLNKNSKGYGDRFHGDGFIPFIKTLKGNSIIDIGTGRGGICEEYSNFFETVYGLDLALDPKPEIASKKNITFFKGDATEIPLPDKSVDILTSFDVMEHICPSRLDTVIKEMKRVTRCSMLHKICCNKNSSSHRNELEKEFGDGELHLSRGPRSEFWVPLFKNNFEHFYKVNSCFYCVL